MIEPTRRAADPEAWRAIEARLRPFVARRVATAADVDDVLQEIFVRIQRGASLRDDERMSSWLFAIARNAVVDHHRDRSRHPVAAGEEEPEPPPDTASELLDHELTSCVARFVTLLPDDYREAITLVELEGMSQVDAAAMLGLSRSGMKSRVQRGRAALRRMFEEACALELDARRKVIECLPRTCGGCDRTPD
jgi:RNA polymerase sigma-70 factor, ECF subfamily